MATLANSSFSMVQHMDLFNTYQSIVKIIVFIKQGIVSCGSIKIDPAWAKGWHETCEHSSGSKDQQIRKEKCLI